MKFLPFVYVLMLFVIFVLPFYSLENYSIVKHTTSQLGAQSTPNAWVMNLTFALLGIATIIDGWGYLGDFWFQKIILVIFGISILLAGVYSHEPIDPTLVFDARENELHSVFASLTGWSFVIFAVSMGFVETTQERKMLAFGIAILATLLSILIFQVEIIRGIWQRLIFISSFAWMIFLFRTER